ncbi:hypothetical protein J2W91_001405 [Paenibacillus amylolyticus]|uniref:Uncharacterized protein n=2 Tax=Paenibacillus TaxID=44249 RepID=A0AAP5H1C3_PAEAM|nr:hypothetical protein [Paenibacillus amylolyticus]
MELREQRTFRLNSIFDAEMPPGILRNQKRTF